MKTSFRPHVRHLMTAESRTTMRLLRRALVALAASGILTSATAVRAETGPPTQQDSQPSASDRPMSLATLFQIDDEIGIAEKNQAGGKDESDSTGQKATERDAIDVLTDPPMVGNEDLNVEEKTLENTSLFSGRQTKYVDGQFSLPPIEALTTNTDDIGDGKLPAGFREGEQAPVMSLPESGMDRDVAWQWHLRPWAASNMFTHPLYFEDRMLERHGHQRFPHLQPAISGGRFLASTFMLPYLSTINPPCECQYTLGYFRTGNCVPAFKQRPPYKRSAAAAQAAAVVGAVAALP
ncbi:hypothetical protein FYK55_10440 [Roseiconus nitratireducens]|uniref:Uncharacterized protein n=1 Tax=Roseiconus nitratireducens TaxID=2605748 RepID=A0A5M6DB46_9BACT|nr:hypothetical protein [Roseiconus nitratireducens]KAA5543620.1 hypothetical protein FYK55_10440 [Roseiconus nitratireducens]